MEVVEGVHSVDGLGMGRAYLAVETDRVTLIDTGLTGSADRILGAVEAAGRKAADVRQIVITHHHADHTGSLATLVERTGAQVLVHPLDAAIVRGERPPPGPSSGGLLKPLLRRLGRPAAGARVDREVDEGDEIDCLGGLRVLHTPGHTPGSISLYCPGRRLLFAGDAIANVRGLGPPIGWFTEDAAQAKESIRKLAALDFEAAFFGHGPPLDSGASNAFRRLAEKLR